MIEFYNLKFILYIVYILYANVLITTGYHVEGKLILMKFVLTRARMHARITSSTFIHDIINFSNVFFYFILGPSFWIFKNAIRHRKIDISRKILSPFKKFYLKNWNEQGSGQFNKEYPIYIYIYIYLSTFIC